MHASTIVELQFSGITGTVALSLVNYFTQNFIGLAYVNANEPELIRLAYVDFWGRRKNVDVRIDDISPTSEQAKIPLDFWVPIKMLTTKSAYKLMHRHGQILDADRFTYIFGEC